MTRPMAAMRRRWYAGWAARQLVRELDRLVCSDACHVPSKREKNRGWSLVTQLLTTFLTDDPPSFNAWDGPGPVQLGFLAYMGSSPLTLLRVDEHDHVRASIW